MAIQKEIWMAAVVEGLFASNSFLSKAFNADGYVNSGKIVHIPNAGAASGTKKNRTSLPAAVTKREDIDVTFPLDEYTTDPVLIPNADTVELSYDKRESVLRQNKLKLQDTVALDFLFNWSPSAGRCIETTGAEIDAYTAGATGKRRGLCKADVLALMTKFNNDDIPQEGRYLLLDAQMYSQLLNDLTANENTAFLASADAQNGVLGKLFSFNVMMRSKAGLYTGEKAPKSWGTAGAVDDLAAGLAWHEQSVCRALGEVNAFENEGDPTYYGDIYSFLVRAGGRILRSDSKGVAALVQGREPFKVSPKEVEFTAAGGTETVTVRNHTGAIKVNGSPEWTTVTVKDDTLTVEAQKNEGAAREGTVFCSFSRSTFSFKVKQAGKE